MKLLFLDVDGTLTDGKLYFSSQNSQIKAFDVKDGLAIASWIKLGFKVAIITGRASKILEKRAQELGVHYLHQNCKNKLEKLQEIATQENINLSQIAGIGDDLNDLKALKAIGKSFCPKDANELIKPFVSMVLDKKGGNGAVAQAIWHLIQEKNMEKDYLSLWS